MHLRARVAGLVAGALLISGGALVSPPPVAADPPPPLLGNDIAPRPPAPALPTGAGFAAVAGPGFNIRDYNGYRPLDLPAYTLRLVSNSQGSVEGLRSAVTLAADQIEDISGVDITVAAGTVADVAGDRQPVAGELLISYDATSPCPGVAGDDWAGCAGPDLEQYHAASATVTLRAGRMWIAPAIAGYSTSGRNHVVAHELGHALGLRHYDDVYAGTYQVMHSGLDGYSVGNTYRAGDQNGFDYLAPRACSPAETGPTQAFIKASFADLWDRAPSSTELSSWTTDIVGGIKCRTALLDHLLDGTPYLYDVVDEAYQELDRAPSNEDRAYWADQLRTGAYTTAQLHRFFLASGEFWINSESNNGGFVDQLYLHVLGYAPSAPSRAYWVGQLTGATRSSVAWSIYQSAESRGKRIDAITDHLLGRILEPSGRDYWVGVLASNSGDDVAVTRSLAATAEYYTRADVRF